MEETNREIRIRNLKWLEKLGGTIEEDSKDEPRDSLPEEGDPHRREKRLSTSNNNSGKPPSETGGQEKEREAPCNFSLPPGCNPVEWVALRWEVVTAHRYFRCQYYGDCLEYAGLSAWQGMSCSRCERFVKIVRKAIGTKERR